MGPLNSPLALPAALSERPTRRTKAPLESYSTTWLCAKSATHVLPEPSTATSIGMRIDPVPKCENTEGGGVYGQGSGEPSHDAAPAGAQAKRPASRAKKTTRRRQAG